VPSADGPVTGRVEAVAVAVVRTDPWTRVKREHDLGVRGREWLAGVVRGVR